MLFENGTVDFSLAINQFADLSPQALKRITSGNQLPPYEFSNYTVRPKNVVVINTTMFPPGPPSIDWKAHVTPVKDQGYYCSSCWAFSVRKIILGPT